MPLRHYTYKTRRAGHYWCRDPAHLLNSKTQEWSVYLTQCCLRSADSTSELSVWRNTNLHLVYLSHINCQKGSRWMEKKDINKARLLMLSNLICWREAHLMIALKLPLINPVKQDFLSPTLKSSTLPYNNVDGCKASFSPHCQKAKQTCFKECCELSLSNRDNFIVLGADTRQLRTTDTHRVPAVLWPSTQLRWHLQQHFLQSFYIRPTINFCKKSFKDKHSILSLEVILLN